jgi:acetyl coenzyme A synthetase (ADP forming)-like protein
MRHPLDALLRPRSVAVVGASRSRASVGGEIFANLVCRPFEGAVYPVNPGADCVQGVRAYPNVAALPGPPELAVVAVPPRAVVPVLEQCAAAGTKAAVVITAGFGEAGEAGRRDEERVRAIAKASSMRIVGPNCLGVLNTDPEVALHATFATAWPPQGGVSIASQSGALGIALLDQAQEHGIGVRQFVSLGNGADLAPEELLEYWERDPKTSVILLYLESVAHPRRFLEVARRVTRSVPVVAVKSGRSIAGARAAGSHTGALATKDVLIDTLLAQAGVVRVATLEELFDAATLFASRQGSFGRRVAVITNAGGPGILTADACEARGLAIPSLLDLTVAALEGAVPGVAAGNPLDLLAGATAATFDAAIPLVLGDAGVDEVIVECVPTTTTDVRDVAKYVAAARTFADKPIVACVMGKHGVDEARAILRKAKVPVYALPESAATALRAAAGHCENAERAGAAEEVARPAMPHPLPSLQPATESRWLGPPEICDLLGAFGIRLLAPTEVRDADEAVRAAETIGWPVALKVVSKGVLHKSDVGGVVLGIPDADRLKAAAAAIERGLRSSDRRLDGFLVQPMAPRGVEMFVGATRDAAFGSVIAFGTGGVQLELWNDVVCRLGPLSPADARAMLDSVRGRKLLDGFRGGPAGDREALAEAIVRVSALMEVMPRVLELDINPLLALEPGRGVVALDARVRVGPGGDRETSP